MQAAEDPRPFHPAVTGEGDLVLQIVTSGVPGR
jgi:hypothetical protein